MNKRKIEEMKLIVKLYLRHRLRSERGRVVSVRFSTIRRWAGKFGLALPSHLKMSLKYLERLGAVRLGKSYVLPVEKARELAEV